MTVFLDKDSSLVKGYAPQLDLTEGGQNGLTRAPHQWVSGHSHVRQKLFATLISAPSGYQWMEDTEKRIATLKALIEVLPLTIEGLTSTITWEFSETPVGNSGEMHETVIDAKRARSVPSFTWSEKAGEAIAKFFTENGILLQMDPETGYPGIISAPKYIEAGSPTILGEHQSMMVLYYEADATLTNITNAWLVSNQMMKSGGEILGKREIAGAGEVPTVSIEFTGMTLSNSHVVKMAKEHLATLKLEDLRPDDLKPYTSEISADVKAATSGLASKITDSVV